MHTDIYTHTWNICSHYKSLQAWAEHRFGIYKKKVDGTKIMNRNSITIFSIYFCTLYRIVLDDMSDMLWNSEESEILW